MAVDRAGDVCVLGSTVDLTAGASAALVGRDLLDRIDQLAGRGVVALPAVYDRSDAVRVEDARQTGAGCYRDNGQRQILDRYRRARTLRPRRAVAPSGRNSGRCPGRCRSGSLGLVRAYVHMRAAFVVVGPGASLGRSTDHLGGALLANLVRLGVEVLDGDPGQRPERETQRDDKIGSLVVDVDLDRPRVAGGNHELLGAAFFDHGQARDVDAEAGQSGDDPLGVA